MKEDLTYVMGLLPEDLTQNQQEKKKRLMSLLQAIMKNELTERQRDAIQKCFIEGMSFVDLAELRGTNKSTEFRHYYRGMAKIKRILEYVLIMEGNFYV